MRIPKQINENSTIGVVAPSFGINSEKYLIRYNIGKKQLEKLGFKIVECKSLFKLDKAQSNSPKTRAREFMKFYLDDSIDFVWSVCGGELMNEILPYIDFEILKKAKPKWFVGFSDNTNLTYTITTKCNIASIYAMNLAEFFSEQPEEASYDLLNLLLNKKTSFTQYENELVCLNKGKSISIEGRLLGGCLDVIMNFIGTQYDNTNAYLKKHNDVIWYLEACDYNVCGLKRCLWQLNELGYFNNCKGIILGKMMNGDEQFGLTMEDVVKLLPQNIPVVYNVQLGHVPPIMPFINGAYVKVEVKNKKYKMTYDLNKR
jgi:muramoyltetrapeptide carboxypeptidase